MNASTSVLTASAARTADVSTIESANRVSPAWSYITRPRACSTVQSSFGLPFGQSTGTIAATFGACSTRSRAVARICSGRKSCVVGSATPTRSAFTWRTDSPALALYVSGRWTT